APDPPGSPDPHDPADQADQAASAERFGSAGGSCSADGSCSGDGVSSGRPGSADAFFCPGCARPIESNGDEPSDAEFGGIESEDGKSGHGSARGGELNAELPSDDQDRARAVI
ncbi:hypothetical protein, partial [Planotetraspora phitsanulokensis]|uniref:hypothetical protein n=1 Tax=Planotetraspora phitsanulokensis TaxID=575192 RepID=UPI00357122E1